MILDINTTLSIAQAITVTAPSSNVYDVAGFGFGVKLPTSVIFGRQATVFGGDIGIGDGVSPPRIVAIAGTGFAATGSATLQTQLQASVDDGNGGAVAWDTIIETDAIAKALLLAGTQFAEFTVPPRYLGQAFPRFYRLNYVVASGPFTDGTVVYAGIATGIDNAPAYPRNY